jgi:hypothetical protein
MAVNHYFSKVVKGEQRLYEDIIIESLKIYGQDVYYLPRDIVNEDTILGEDVQSSYNSSHKVEMYIENTDGFDGEGDLFTKFGVEIRDEATFVVSKTRWKEMVLRYDNEMTGERPREGDVIYLELSKSFFKITHVEHESPFYQLSNLPTFKLRCEKFEYADEDFDTGNAIDQEAEKYAYVYQLTMDSSGPGYRIGEKIQQTLADGTNNTGEVHAWNDSSNVLDVIHVGNTSGSFSNLVTGIAVLGNDSRAFCTPTAVTQGIESTKTEMNDQFETTATDMSFLDFTESNPFGDPQ